MKMKLAVAACLAALVLPMAPASADEGIPGTCTTIEIYGTQVSSSSSPCECILFVWPPEFYGGRIVLKYCTVYIKIDRAN